MASNLGGGGFQRGGRPAPAPEGGDFFGLAALVFGAGATLMIVAAIAAMFISFKSESAVAVEAPPAAPAPVAAEAAAPPAEAAPAEGDMAAPAAEGAAPVDGAETAATPAPAAP